MSNEKQSILLVSYYFPPETNGGASRAFANYHYLNKQGYRVIVITNDRTSNIDCVADIYRVRCWRNAGIIGLTKRILGSVLTKLGFYYGEDLYWCDAVSKAIKSLKGNIDIVYASFPGADALIVGMSTANILNAKLVTEFRDGFYFEPHISMNIFQRWGAKRLEKKVVEASEKIVCATRTITEYFKETYRNENIHTIYNGYNKLDFKAYDAGNMDDGSPPATLIHLGQLAGSRKRSIRPLLDALMELYDDGEINRNNFELLFLGTLTDQELENLSDLFLSGIVKYRPSVPKEQAFSIVSDYKYLLFYGVPGQKSVVSSKLLEYIRMGKPVLGVCKGNEAAEIIDLTGVGEVADYDKEEIKALFINALNGTVTYIPNTDQIKFFDRENQVNKLSEILEE